MPIIADGSRKGGRQFAWRTLGCVFPPLTDAVRGPVAAIRQLPVPANLSYAVSYKRVRACVWMPANSVAQQYRV